MLNLREANILDLHIIADFQLSMSRETEDLELDKTIVIKGINKILSDPPTGKYFIAEKNNMVVASLLTLYEWSDWRNGQMIWIHSVYVLPQFRKEGIFKTMYAHLKSIVEQNEQYKGLRLFVDKSNTIARKVYHSLGMNGEHYALYEWMKGE